jgi:hypothetical protein
MASLGRVTETGEGVVRRCQQCHRRHDLDDSPYTAAIPQLSRMKVRRYPRTVQAGVAEGASAMWSMGSVGTIGALS